MKTRVLLSLALMISVFCMNVKAIDPVTDSYSYPKRGDYTLKSSWLYSLTTETYSAAPNMLNVAQGTVRTMAYWNDKLVFGSRNDGVPAVIVVDPVTGTVERTVTLVADGFSAIQNPCNYIAVDAGNNVLVGNVKLANTGVLQIWKVDMTTGISTKLVEAGPSSIAIADRLDAFGVLGDVSQNATIWAVASTSTEGSLDMFRWRVTNGVVAPDPDLILIDFTAGGFPANVTAMGTSPCVYPVSEDLAYIDGSNTYPTLVQITGDAIEGYSAVAIDGFYDVLDATLPVPNAVDAITNPEKEFTMTPSHNGFAQFSLGDDHFFIIPTNAHGNATPFQAFRLYKYKDDALRTREAEIFWTFPEAGLSPNTNNQNNYFIAPIAVKIEGDKAVIYIYSGENGLARYELKKGGTDVKTPHADKMGIYVSDRTIQFTESVASAQVYNVAGQLVAKANKVSSVAVTASGVYVVKATALNGETTVSKIIVK